MQKPRGTSEALFTLTLVFLLCVAVGIAGTSLLWPLSWDEGIFAWIGGVMRRGGTPYVDAWDVKGPIVYFGYALANALFGPSAHGVRLLDLLLTIAGTTAVYRILLPEIERRGALIAALLLFISVLGQGYNVNGQPDLWAAWFLVFVVMLVRVPVSVARIAVAATLLGITVLMKPVYAALGLLLIVPMTYTHGKDWKVYPRYALAIAVCGAAPIALVIAWFWSRGALHEFRDAYIGFNIESGGSNHRTISGVTDSILAFLGTRRAVLVALPAIGIGLLANFRSTAAAIPVWRIRLVATWIFTLLALIILQNRWFSYHWAPTYPPLAIAAAIGFHRLLTWQRTDGLARAVRWATLATLGLISVGASLAPLRQISYAAKVATHRITIDQYLATFNDYPVAMTASDVRMAAQYVKSHTQPTDYVLVWQDPNVNVLSGRPTPGRFGFWTPLLPAFGTVMNARYDRNRIEFFRALEQRPPALVMMERAAWRGGNLRGITTLPEHFPAFVEWIDAGYVEVDTVGAFLAFRKR